MNTRGQIFLTFDVEDFINEKSITSLFKVLRLLDDYGIKGIFFITGNFALNVLKRNQELISLTIMFYNINLFSHIINY